MTARGGNYNNISKMCASVGVPETFGGTASDALSLTPQSPPLPFPRDALYLVPTLYCTSTDVPVYRTRDGIVTSRVAS